MKIKKVIIRFLVFIIVLLITYGTINWLSDKKCNSISDYLILKSEVSPKAQLNSDQEKTIGDEKSKRNILVIYSYESSYKWTEDERNGIESTLLVNSQYIHIQSEYMDTKRIYDKDYFNKLFNLYKYKYSGYKFDAIIACDNEAMEFLKLYRTEIFKDTPIIFCGINKPEDYKLELPNTYVIKEKADFNGNLELIQKLHPKANNITVVVDKTISGNEFKKLFEDSIREMNFKKNVKIIEEQNINRTIREINAVPKDNVVFYLGPTFYEYEGYTSKINNIEALKMIQNKISVPIYSAWDIFLGDGIVGGKLISGRDQGRMAAEFVNNMLFDKNLNQNKSNYPIYKYSFDYEQLVRFNIKTSDLPTESIIINKPWQGLFISEKDIKIIITLSIILLVFIVFIVMAINFRLKNTEKRLKKLLILRDSMLEINEEIIHMEEIKELYDLILEKALKAIKGDNIGSILILKEDGYLHVEAYRGFKKEGISKFKLRPEESFLWIKSNGSIDKSMIINNIDKFIGIKFLEVEGMSNGEHIRSNMASPIFVDGKFHGMLNIDSIRDNAFNEDDLMALNYLKNQIEIAINKHNMYEKIKSLSIYDRLTEIYNRGYFEELCKDYINSKMEKLLIVMFDINCLKVINDSLGHLAGDILIKNFSQGLKAVIKDYGFAGRVGGDEFAAVLLNVDKEKVEEKIKELMESFEKNPIYFEEVEFVCSFSYGIAVFPKEAETYNELIKLADKRMYENKKECKIVSKNIINLHHMENDKY